MSSADRLRAGHVAGEVDGRHVRGRGEAPRAFIDLLEVLPAARARRPSAGRRGAVGASLLTDVSRRELRRAVGGRRRRRRRGEVRGLAAGAALRPLLGSRRSRARRSRERLGRRIDVPSRRRTGRILRRRRLAVAMVGFGGKIFGYVAASAFGGAAWLGVELCAVCTL